MTVIWALVSGEADAWMFQELTNTGLKAKLGGTGEFCRSPPSHPLAGSAQVVGRTCQNRAKRRVKERDGSLMLATLNSAAGV